jgi:hypothetical protein
MNGSEWAWLHFCCGVCAWVPDIYGCKRWGWN